MYRLIDFNYIGDTSSELLLLINILREDQSKLLNDIAKLSNCYQGKDAELVIAKYKERATSITGYIEFLEEYQKYFEWLSGSYRSSYQKAQRDIEAEMLQPVDELADNSFDIESVVEEGNDIWMI